MLWCGGWPVGVALKNSRQCTLAPCLCKINAKDSTSVSLTCKYYKCKRRYMLRGLVGAQQIALRIPLATAQPRRAPSTTQLRRWQSLPSPRRRRCAQALAESWSVLLGAPEHCSPAGSFFSDKSAAIWEAPRHCIVTAARQWSLTTKSNLTGDAELARLFRAAEEEEPA